MIVEFELETDGRWIAEITDIPGVMVYGATQMEALSNVLKLASEVIEGRFVHGEAIPAIGRLAFRDESESK